MRHLLISYGALHCVHQNLCHWEHTKLLKLRHVVKRKLSPVFGCAPHNAKGVRPLINQVRRGCAPRLFSGLSTPETLFGWYSRGCTLKFGANLVMSWHRCRPAVPRVLWNYSDHYLKRGGVSQGYWVWLPMGEKRDKNWGQWVRACCRNRTWMGRGSGDCRC